MSAVPDAGLRQKIGCWLHERWRAELALSPLVPGVRWEGLHNRHEHLGCGSDGARVCEWEDSSFLSVARVFPRLGARLLGRCLREWPVRFAEPTRMAASKSPALSIVLPVGGRDRRVQFECVLAAFAGQTRQDIEIIVVEHGVEPAFEDACPGPVRYAFMPMADGGGYNKSAVFNAGARMATADRLLLHDADIVPPAAYVSGILERFGEWDAVRPIRFMFLLGEEESAAFVEAEGRTLPCEVADVQQNCVGWSTAVTAEAYWAIGGHDERFVGWGGEDWEFLDRLRTRRIRPGGYVPAVHLWHAPAPKKAGGDRNRELTEQLSAIPVAERIAVLCRGRKESSQ